MTSAALKRRRAIGEYFLSYFPALMSQQAVAKTLGMTKSHVAFVERDAAWKVFIRMRARLLQDRLNAES